ncbi:MAG TPA: hypothetical protein VIU62_08280 [Chloroflexota bacterium]
MNTQSRFARFQFTNIPDWLDSLDPDTTQAEEEEQLEALLGDEWAAFEPFEALLGDEWPAYEQLAALLDQEWPALDEVDQDEADKLAKRRRRRRRVGALALETSGGEEPASMAMQAIFPRLPWPQCRRLLELARTFRLGTGNHDIDSEARKEVRHGCN